MFNSQSNKFISKFALLLQIFALLQIVALLFGINCTEIDQSQSSIISVYIIRDIKIYNAISSTTRSEFLLENEHCTV